MSEMVLEFSSIKKQFPGILALNNVSLGLKKGHLLGLIGENGAGKTTLMNILGGIHISDSGTMKIENRGYKPRNPRDAHKTGVAFIHQELNLFNNLTIAENIFINSFPKLINSPFINPKKLNHRAKKLIESVNLKVSPHTMVESLAPGEKQLVEIAKALSSDAKIIIFDEPTTSLTTKETEKLFDIIKLLKESGKSIIYISHILSDVMKIADDIAVLRDGKLIEWDEKSNFTINKMIASMVGRDINNFYPERKDKPREKVIFKVENINQTGIVKNISFNVKEGDILGIFGLMGSGRSELARLIFGLDPYETGKVTIFDEQLPPLNPKESITKGLAFVTEDRRDEGLLMDISIAENMGLVALPQYSKKALSIIDRSSLYKSVLETSNALKIKSSSILENPAKSLSGGNQQKVVIGKWLMSVPSVLIMDEPTRGIDVGSKSEIYNIINKLANDGSGIIFISSEIEELIRICDRIIVMSMGEMIKSFDKDSFNREKILRTAFRQ